MLTFVPDVKKFFRGLTLDSHASKIKSTPFVFEENLYFLVFKNEGQPTTEQGNFVPMVPWGGAAIVLLFSVLAGKDSFQNTFVLLHTLYILLCLPTW